MIRVPRFATLKGKAFVIGSTIVDPSARACALAQDDKLLHYCVILSEASETSVVEESLRLPLGLI